MVHSLSFDDFEIYVQDSNDFRLFLRESFLTSHDEPLLNKYARSLLLEFFSYFSLFWLHSISFIIVRRQVIQI